MEKTTSRKFVILAMLLGLLMASLDNTIVSASINKVIEDLKGFDLVSWVFTGYALAATSTMLIFGKLSDLYGRKMFYLLGIGLFVLGSALCGLSQNMNQLILFRIIQGIGSGALMPISFTIIFTIFNDPKDASKMTGLFAGVFGLSSVAGPQLGTWISEWWGWRWCFYVNLPLGIASFLVLLFTLKETRSEKRPKVDIWGTLMIIVSTVSVMLALTWGGKDYAWGSWQVIGLFGLFLCSAIAFVWIERYAEEPILPLELFKIRKVTTTSIISFCSGVVMFSAITYIPILCVGVLGYPNSNSLLTPMMLSLMIGASAAGMLMTKLSFRSVFVFTMVFSIGIGYALTQVGETTPKWQIIGIMILTGLCAIGPLMSVAQNAVMISVENKYQGIVSSLIGFWRTLGGVLGASIMATIVNNEFKQQISGTLPKGMPADPEVLMHASSQIPKEALAMLRGALSVSIHDGFYVVFVAGVLGLITAFFVGKGKFQRMIK